jgi:hypothetical protein
MMRFKLFDAGCIRFSKAEDTLDGPYPSRVDDNAAKSYTFLNTIFGIHASDKQVFKKVLFSKNVYVLGEQYLLEQHLIRTKDGEDAVPKSIQASQNAKYHCVSTLASYT